MSKKLVMAINLCSECPFYVWSENFDEPYCKMLDQFLDGDKPEDNNCQLEED